MLRNYVLPHLASKYPQLRFRAVQVCGYYADASIDAELKVAIVRHTVQLMANEHEDFVVNAGAALAMRYFLEGNNKVSKKQAKSGAGISDEVLALKKCLAECTKDVIVGMVRVMDRVPHDEIPETLRLFIIQNQ